MYDRCSAWSWYTFQPYPDRLRCRCHITQSLGDVLPVGAPSTLWGNVHGKNVVLRRFPLTETTGHLRICMHEFILFHTWILMADMCFIVFLCVFFSRMSFENVSSICPHSGIFWLLSAKDAFHLLLMVFLCDNFFFACQYHSVSVFFAFLFVHHPTECRRGFAPSLRNSIASGFPFLLQYGAYVLLAWSFPNVPVSLNVAPLECSHVLYLMEICCPIPLAKTISSS